MDKENYKILAVGYGKKLSVREIVNNIVNARNATREERESVGNYVKKVSTETGVNFYDLINQSETGEK